MRARARLGNAQLPLCRFLSNQRQAFGRAKKCISLLQSSRPGGSQGRSHRVGGMAAQSLVVLFLAHGSLSRRGKPSELHVCPGAVLTPRSGQLALLPSPLHPRGVSVCSGCPNKYCGLGLQLWTLLSAVPEAESPRSGCQGLFLVRPRAWFAAGQLPTVCSLTWWRERS